MPTPRTSLIGRDDAVATLIATLQHDGPRLLTLTGPAGVGKTRLAIAIAASLRNAHADGVAFASLAVVLDPMLVAPTLASALGAREDPTRSPADTLVAALRERHVLLVLDNLEHLAPAIPLVAHLLQTCPHLTILATSRTPLHLSGERLFHVPPLTPPDLTIPSADRLRQNPAVRLFVDRVTPSRPGFALTDENAAAIAAICHRLDGLPLAVELAAARTRAHPPSAVLARLDDPLRFLTDGPPTAAPHQRTLHDTIAWSHNLLTPSEQTLFRRLSAFPAGFTLDADEFVCGQSTVDGRLTTAECVSVDRRLSTVDSVLDALASLLDHNLIRDVPDPPIEPRYAMLETLLEYAADRLAESGEWDLVHDRLADWCLRLVEREEPVASHDATNVGFDVLDAEIGNLRSALTWLRDQGDAARGLRLVTNLRWFLTDRGHLTELGTWLDAFVSLPVDHTLLPQRAAALGLAADVSHWSGNSDRANELLEEALAILRRQNDPGPLARALTQLGHLRRERADAAGAADAYREAMTLATAAGEELISAQATTFLGRCLLDGNERATGLALLADAVTRLRGLGSHWLGLALHMLAFGRLLDGDVAGARANLAECLAHALAHDDRWRISNLLAECAEIAHRDGSLHTATRLAAVAARQRNEYGVALHPDTQTIEDRWLANLRRDHGDLAFQLAWAGGSNLSREEAIAEAQAVLSGHLLPDTDPHAPPPITLTRREREVLTLLAQGASNQEIAETLSLAYRTAETHVRRLCRKLGVESRTAAVATAYRLRLLP